MHISIDVEASIVVLMEKGCLRRVDCWMSDRAWLCIYSIQIKPLGVISPVSTLDSIWIKTRDNLKNKHGE